MGTRLRKLKVLLQAKTLNNGEKFGGANRVTDASILGIQKYYGLAIRINRENLQEMKERVWAIYFHLLSSNENPQYGLCSISWCKFLKAKKQMKNMTEMKSVFRELADPDLLKNCLHGGTQNPKESLHNVIWIRLPKNVFIGISILHIGVYNAVATFNKGNIVKCLVLKKIGLNCVSVMEKLDEVRVNRAVQEIHKKLDSS